MTSERALRILRKIAAEWQDMYADVGGEDLRLAKSTIAGFEGSHKDPNGMHTVYKDTKGVDTIGYGMTDKGIIDQYRAGGMPEAVAQKMFHNRVLKDYRALSEHKYFDKLNPHQRSSLTSFRYNVGPVAYDNSTLKKYLDAGEFDKVPGELAKWKFTRDYNDSYTDKTPGVKFDDKRKKYYIPKVVKGLENRRNAEIELWNKPWNPTPEPPPEPQVTRRPPQPPEEPQVTRTAKPVIPPAEPQVTR